MQPIAPLVKRVPQDLAGLLGRPPGFSRGLVGPVRAISKHIFGLGVFVLRVGAFFEISWGGLAPQ
eukprot:8088806-Pyramimonas_sp.AAC.1